MPTPDTIGARIRYWRLRRGGMTQTVLAGLAGVTQGYISQIEVGRKTVENRSTLTAIAAALQVSVADLIGQPGDPTDPVLDGAAAAIPRIRVALVEIEEHIRHGRTDLDRVDAGIGELAALRRNADYAGIARRLPDLLPAAAVAGGTRLARVGYETACALKNLGYRDLALPAARVAVHAAEDADDPAWMGAARFFHSVVMPMDAPALGVTVAERSITVLQPRAADRRVRQMLGQLHLTCALSCAVAGRAGDAFAHLAAADVEARTLGGDPDDGIGFNLLGFGPTNINLWRMTVLAELGEHEKVIELGRRVHPGVLRMADRPYSYWLNIGRALVHARRRDGQALAALIHAERAAPTAFAASPLPRHLLRALVQRARRRAIPAALSTLARRAGIDT